jgi:protein arginine kinase activator
MKMPAIQPMKCQQCSKPATVHLTNVEPGGQKREIHLCEACAQKKNYLSKQQELNLPNILQTLIGAHVGAWSDEMSRLACPLCGLKYMEFRTEGRLGCPHDYEVFKSGLTPLLQKIHRAERHVGKSPRCRGRSPQWQREILELRRQLRQAIDEEAFERAATLRDLIRHKETHG